MKNLLEEKKKKLSKLSVSELKGKAKHYEIPFLGVSQTDLIEKLAEFEYKVENPSISLPTIVDNRGRKSSISDKVREMHFDKGMKFSEIAKEMGMKPQHVRNICVYERKTLPYRTGSK
jgi:hypothetical protein